MRTAFVSVLVLLAVSTFTTAALAGKKKSAPPPAPAPAYNPYESYDPYGGSPNSSGFVNTPWDFGASIGGSYAGGSLSPGSLQNIDTNAINTWASTNSLQPGQPVSAPTPPPPSTYGGYTAFAPEVDPSSLVSALGVVAGSIVLWKERRRRRSAPART